MSYRSRYISSGSGLSSNRSYGGSYRSSFSSASSFRSRYDTVPTQENTSTPSYHSSLPRAKYYSREDNAGSNDTSLRPSYSSLTWRGPTSSAAARRTAEFQESPPGSGNDKTELRTTRPSHSNGTGMYRADDYGNGKYRPAEKPRSRYLQTSYTSKDDRNITKNRYNSTQKTFEHTIEPDKNANSKQGTMNGKNSQNRSNVHSYVIGNNGTSVNSGDQAYHCRLGKNSEYNEKTVHDQLEAEVRSGQNNSLSLQTKPSRREPNNFKTNNNTNKNTSNNLSNTNGSELKNNSENSNCIRPVFQEKSSKEVADNVTDSSSGCEVSSDDETSGADSNASDPVCERERVDETTLGYTISPSSLRPGSKCQEEPLPKRPTTLDFKAKRTYIPVAERKIEQVVNGANEKEKNSLFKMAYSAAMIESKSDEIKQKLSPRISDKSPINNIENILVTAPRPYHSPSRSKTTYPVRISPSPSRANHTSLHRTSQEHSGKVSKSSDSQLPPHPSYHDKNRIKISDQNGSGLSNKLSSRYKELNTARRRTISQSSGTNSGGRNSRNSSISRGSSPDLVRTTAVQRCSSFEENKRKQMVRPNIYRPRSRQNSGCSSDGNSTRIPLRQTSRSNSSSGIDNVKKRTSVIPSLGNTKRLGSKPASKSTTSSSSLHLSRNSSAASSMTSLASSSECQSSKSPKTASAKSVAHNFWEEILHNELSSKEQSDGSANGRKYKNDTSYDVHRLLPGQEHISLEINKSDTLIKTDSGDKSLDNGLFDALLGMDCETVPNCGRGDQEQRETSPNQQNYGNIEPYVKPTMFLPDNDEDTSTNIDLKNSDTAGQIGSLSDFSLLSSAESFDNIPHLFDSPRDNANDYAGQKAALIALESRNASNSASFCDLKNAKTTLSCNSLSEQNCCSFKEPFSIIDYDVSNRNQRDSGYLTEDRLHFQEISSLKELSNLPHQEVSKDTVNSSPVESGIIKDQTVVASSSFSDHSISTSCSRSKSRATESRNDDQNSTTSSCSRKQSRIDSEHSTTSSCSRKQSKNDCGTSSRAESLDNRRSISSLSTGSAERDFHRVSEDSESISENIHDSHTNENDMSQAASSNSSTSESRTKVNVTRSRNDPNTSLSRNGPSDQLLGDKSGVWDPDTRVDSRNSVDGIQRSSTVVGDASTMNDAEEVTTNGSFECQQEDEIEMAKQHLSHFISNLTNIDEVIGALKSRGKENLSHSGTSADICSSAEPLPGAADESEDREIPADSPASLVDKEQNSENTDRPSSRSANVQQQCSALIENLEGCENEHLYDVLYSMKKVFQENKQMVPEFTSRAGLDTLMMVAVRSDSKAKNYILRALGQLMLYVDGMAAVVASCKTVQWLYSLLDEDCSDSGVASSPAEGGSRGGSSEASEGGQCRYMLVKTALRLMLVFVEYTADNALRLVEAIHAVDSSKGLTPWFSLVSLLGEGDPLDVQLAQYSIKLINRCLFAIDDLDHFYDQADCMDQLGMETTIVRYIGRPDADRPLSEQLQLYEAVLRHEDGESTHGLSLPADANFRRSRRVDPLWSSPDARVSSCCRRREQGSTEVGAASFSGSAPLQYRPVCDAWSVSERRKVFAASGEQEVTQGDAAPGQIASGNNTVERSAVTALENSISESGMTPALRRRRENLEKAEPICEASPMKTDKDEDAAKRKEDGQSSSHQPTVRDLCEKLARQTHVCTPVSPEAETATASRLDQLTGIVSKAKEGLTRSTRRSPEAPSDQSSTPAAAAAPPVVVQPVKKSDVDLRWEQLVSDLKRPLVLADLDFTDLTDTDDRDQSAAEHGEVGGEQGSAAPAPPPLPALFQTHPPPPPPPLPPLAPSQTASARLSVCSEDGSGPLEENSTMSSNSNLTSKQRKTIKLFWKTVRTDLLTAKSSTVWDELPAVNLDTSKLEILFESKAKDAAVKKQGENKQMKELSVLGHKRSNAINIGMTKLPPPRVIKAAILKMDATVINKDGIEKLLMLLPSDEEMSAITEAQTNNPDLPLGSAETLLLTLGSISEITARLQLWLFRLDYDNVEKEVAEPLMDLKQGLENLMANKTFRRILGMLRGIGNFLNNSQAKGFSFDYLAKVPEVKDTLQKHSLLHHLCRMVTEQFPSSSDLYSEIGAVTRASRVDFREIGATIRRMEGECKASWDHLKLIAKHDGPTQIRLKMSEFLTDSAERIIVLGIVYRRVMNRFLRFLLWLGLPVHQVNDVTPTAVCRVISEFALEYRTTRERVLQQLTKTVTSARQARQANVRQQHCQDGCSLQVSTNPCFDRLGNSRYESSSAPCRSHRKPSVEEKADAELRRLLGRGGAEVDGAVCQSQARSLRRRVLQPGVLQNSECPSAPGEPNGELLSSLMRTADRQAAIIRAPRRHRRSANTLTHRKLSIKRSRTRDTNVCAEE